MIVHTRDKALAAASLVLDVAEVEIRRCDSCMWFKAKAGDAWRRCTNEESPYCFWVNPKGRTCKLWERWTPSGRKDR